MRNSVLSFQINPRFVCNWFVVAFAFTILPAAVAHAQLSAQQFLETTEGNTNRPGNDLRKGFEIVPRVNSIAGTGVDEACREACRRDSACVAWTAVRPGVQSKNGVCWLKRSPGVATKDNCCTSGTKLPKPLSKTGKANSGGVSTPTSASGNFANKILEFSKSKLGQRLGDGECTRLVEGALAYAGAKPGIFPEDPANGDYVWGRRINFPSEPALPGDIIQLVNARLVDGGYSWYTDTQHSAVIESANGKVLQIFEQNIPKGGGVKRSQLNLNWKLDRGFYKIYRPL